jgi:hypothetical protein
MADLPAFYVDNVRLISSRTATVRGNTVSDLSGTTVTGFKLSNIHTLRAKNNKAIRVRSSTAQAQGFDVDNIGDALFVYNVASRTNEGFTFAVVDTLNVYNVTTHNCNTGIVSASDGTFSNLAFSAYPGTVLYRTADGISASGSASVSADCIVHYGLNNLYDGTVSVGSNVAEDKILYLDEPNDDLTPDYISPLVNEGTDNPLHTESPDIGGIESGITTEASAQRDYWYSLLDNSFWDINNPDAVEVGLVKAFQSRGLANTEAELFNVVRDYYIKTANSVERFAELYPMYARYANATKFKKRVADMWFAGQNPATLQAYQNAIGGYNLFPSFFKHMQDFENGWIIDESYVDYDNYIGGYEELNYGIAIDVLGTATLSQSASAECYNNMMNTCADIAPVRWFLHHSPEPDGYTLFTDQWNGYENCTLDNLIYNDDFNISVDVVGASGSCITPAISTASVVVTSVGASAVEISLLDRTWSEDIVRSLYVRTGNATSILTQAWVELENAIGAVVDTTDEYIQFKITVENVSRQIDYEFIGLAMRRYSSARDWTRPQS